MKIRIFLLFVLSSVLGANSYAFLMDLNLGIMQGSFSRATDQNISRSSNSLGLFANLGKPEANSGVLLGWSISAIRNTDKYQGILDQTTTSSDMGPAFRWQTQNQNKQIFSVTYAYGIIAKGNFTDITTSEELNGESHLIKLAIEAYLSEKFLIGFAINFYNANYKTSLVSSIQSSVSYTNNLTYPSLALSYNYY